MTIASLPMYDLEPIREVTDAWWSAVAASLRGHGLKDVPDRLDRGAFADRFAQWSSPDLLLSQTCGYPLTHDFADKLRLVATPRYSAPYCEDASYCSVVLVREDSIAQTIEDMRGTRVAVNGFDSQSGFNALRALVAPHAEDSRFFREVLETGRHHASMQAVGSGKADLCAIDCVTYALTLKHLPGLAEGTRALTMTEPAPNLPYVTHVGRGDDEVEALRSALQQCACDPTLSGVRNTLMLDGFAILPRSAYDRIDAMEREAAEAGYPDLK